MISLIAFSILFFLLILIFAIVLINSFKIKFHIMPTIEEILQTVQAQTPIINQIQATTDDVQAKIADLIAGGGATPAQLQQLSDALAGNTQALQTIQTDLGSTFPPETEEPGEEENA